MVTFLTVLMIEGGTEELQNLPRSGASSPSPSRTSRKMREQLAFPATFQKCRSRWERVNVTRSANVGGKMVWVEYGNEKKNLPWMKCSILRLAPAMIHEQLPPVSQCCG